MKRRRVVNGLLPPRRRNVAPRNEPEAIAQVDRPRRPQATHDYRGAKRYRVGAEVTLKVRNGLRRTDRVSTSQKPVRETSVRKPDAHIPHNLRKPAKRPVRGIGAQSVVLAFDAKSPPSMPPNFSGSFY